MIECLDQLMPTVAAIARRFQCYRRVLGIGPETFERCLITRLSLDEFIGHLTEPN